jgi:hypothetical protein
MIPIDAVMRVVRPMDNLEQITNMYADGLCFEVIGSFDGHGDFSGRMLGHAKHHDYLEFTAQQRKIKACAHIRKSFSTLRAR